MNAGLFAWPPLPGDDYDAPDQPSEYSPPNGTALAIHGELFKIHTSVYVRRETRWLDHFRRALAYLTDVCPCELDAVDVGDGSFEAVQAAVTVALVDCIVGEVAA